LKKDSSVAKIIKTKSTIKKIEVELITIAQKEELEKDKKYVD